LDLPREIEAGEKKGRTDEDDNDLARNLNQQ
jgi:hypothetical protein